MAITETPRLILRPAHKDLAKAVADYYTRNRDFLYSTESDHGDEFYTEAFQVQQMKREMAAWAQGLSARHYISLQSDPQQVIGLITLSDIVYGAFQSCFMGYKLDKDYLNQGYITEAIEAMVKLGFEGRNLHRIEANVMPRNAPSLRVLEKCGFQYEGRSSNYLYINGVWEDHIHMVKLNEAWKSGV